METGLLVRQTTKLNRHRRQEGTKPHSDLVLKPLFFKENKDALCGRYLMVHDHVLLIAQWCGNIVGYIVRNPKHIDWDQLGQLSVAELCS